MSVSRSRRIGALALLAVVSTGLAACKADDGPGASAAGPDEPGASSSSPATPFRVTSTVRRGATAVPVDKPLALRAAHGTIDDVRVTSPAGPLAGKVSADKTTWRATARLEPGTTYAVKVAGSAEGAGSATRTFRFSTQPLSLDQQTYASVAPLNDETVGVGMPVIVTFDVAVKDKAAFEKHMTVTSAPAQPGAWHWVSDREAHWRPRAYWKPGTDVHVDIDVNSVPAGGGIYGQESRQLDFHVGDAQISKVNAKTHQMKVFRNGKLLRTIPITTGKQPDFTTRSGVKVIIEKFREKDMNSETVGITGAEAYNIAGVKWAMRLTFSGEFIHAAPWSVGSQGHANVSHGCTGMSTENAAWLYAHSRRGDVVEYTGTDRPMTLTNGYGDWNEPFRAYKQGSALG